MEYPREASDRPGRNSKCLLGHDYGQKRCTGPDSDCPHDSGRCWPQDAGAVANEQSWHFEANRGGVQRRCGTSRDVQIAATSCNFRKLSCVALEGSWERHAVNYDCSHVCGPRKGDPGALEAYRTLVVVLRAHRHGSTSPVGPQAHPRPFTAVPGRGQTTFSLKYRPAGARGAFPWLPFSPSRCGHFRGRARRESPRPL